MLRRYFLLGGAGALLAGTALRGVGGASMAAGDFEVTRTEAEWRALLSEEQFHVLREAGTERPGTSPLLEEKRKGIFHCAGCDLPVYGSEAKYESGTGWPSFWAAFPDAVATSEDSTLMMVRTECHCRRCGGHFGHIFDDGPPPTYKRHCINGLALTFRPATA